MPYIGSQPGDIPSYSHQTFYGFKLDKSTGNLTVHIIDDALVKFSDANIIDDNDYKDHFWSQQKLTYQWGSGGHIEVVYQ
tara:strand:- start:1920 stop:2159 length:240 start_codon:yes stop_codon:yes gene_type:complete